MTTSNTYGKQVVIPLTNKSGGGIIAGDVVIVDTSNNDAFTTTTSANFTGGVGIAQETIANAAVGRVLISGYAALVNVNASVTRGHYGATFTVAKQATDAGAARGTGTFCQFLTGGTTPDALLYPVDLLGSSLTNPMTTKGDVILGDTGGTPSRLAAGTSAYVLTSNGAGAFPSWQAAAAASGTLLGVNAYHGGSDTSTFTTTSGSLVDVDATNMKVTVTVPASGNVLIQLSALSQCTNRMNWGIRVASSNVGTPCEVTSGNSGDARIHTVSFYLTGQTPGSTTYKWSWSTGSSATGTIFTGPTYGDAIMTVWGN